MTTYTITVRNQSGEAKSYVLFKTPPVMTSPGGQTPVYANAWVIFENVTDGGWDSAVYAEADVTNSADAAASPESAPSFYVAENDGAPGQLTDPSQISDPVPVDFTERSQTTATVTQDAGGGFSVAYD
ncbi:hypothetical protein PMI01_04364 [Caulobacter sp. AP07]|uniref:hypothetical protein n=1 Tax=Caulobacter sp. AP07 TaxID=1144304 RepID=UPI000271FD0A|nr:hypothetical protein [Caulobacter sp. AP07]EJL25460.1 hypothetical protein PMI01_04364 [Caulobacter sp. AP07]